MNGIVANNVPEQNPTVVIGNGVSIYGSRKLTSNVGGSLASIRGTTSVSIAVDAASKVTADFVDVAFISYDKTKSPVALAPGGVSSALQRANVASVTLRQGSAQTPISSTSTEYPYIISLPAVSPAQSSALVDNLADVCVFWNTTSLSWSKKGCVASVSSDNRVECHCFHTTLFSTSGSSNMAGSVGTTSNAGVIRSLQNTANWNMIVVALIASVVGAALILLLASAVWDLVTISRWRDEPSSFVWQAQEEAQEMVAVRTTREELLYLLKTKHILAAGWRTKLWHQLSRPAIVVVLTVYILSILAGHAMFLGITHRYQSQIVGAAIACSLVCWIFISLYVFLLSRVKRFRFADSHVGRSVKEYAVAEHMSVVSGSGSSSATVAPLPNGTSPRPAIQRPNTRKVVPVDSSSK